MAPFAAVVRHRFFSFFSFAASGTRDPRLRQRMAQEHAQIERVRREFANRLATVPWVPEEPVGEAGLRALLVG